MKIRVTDRKKVHFMATNDDGVFFVFSLDFDPTHGAVDTENGDSFSFLIRNEIDAGDVLEGAFSSTDWEVVVNTTQTRKVSIRDISRTAIKDLALQILDQRAGSKTLSNERPGDRKFLTEFDKKWWQFWK